MFSWLNDKLKEAGSYIGQKVKDTSSFLGEKAKQVVNLLNKGINLAKEISTSSKAEYDGEMHGMLELPDGTFKRAQYMGPGTRIDLRLKLGQEGLTPIDKESLAHDLRFTLLKGTPEEQKQQIRKADNKFNEKIAEFRSKKTDSEFNLKQADLIKVKNRIEDSNSMIHDAVYKMHKRKSDIDESPPMMLMYENKLTQLANAGY